MRAQALIDDRLHIRIRMNGIDHVNVAAVGDLRESLADSLEPLTEAFAPVRGDQDQPFARALRITIEARAVGRQLAALETVANVEHGIDSGIASNPQVFGDAFTAEILRRSRRGSEMQVGQLGCENAI